MVEAGKTSFIIEKKFLSFQDTYIIKNKEGAQLGKAEKKPFSSNIVFKDNDGNEIFSMKRELISFHPNYKILDPEGKLIAKINKKFNLFGASFSVEDENKEKIFDVRGDLLNYNYFFIGLNKTVVARVHKELIFIRDSFYLDIIEEIDPRIVLGCCISIDMMRKK